jgi:hypothetical protein
VQKLTPRAWTLIFGVIAVLSLILLAGSLNTLELKPGQEFHFEEAAETVYEQNVPEGWTGYLLVLFRIILILGWVLIPLYLILLIFSKEARKRFLRDMVMVLPILVMLYLLNTSQVARNMAENLEINFQEMEMAEIEGPGDLAPPEFTPPPDWVTTLAIVIIALVAAAILAGTIYIVWKRSRERTYEPIHRVEKEARAALDAIETGGDLREAIIRCYVQMIEALKEYRGIYRDRDMTAHEFELFLTKRGLPREPIHQLTQLFEQVRYGAQAPGRREENQAISSLSAIISACQKTRST